MFSSLLFRRTKIRQETTPHTMHAEEIASVEETSGGFLSRPNGSEKRSGSVFQTPHFVSRKASTDRPLVVISFRSLNTT